MRKVAILQVVVLHALICVCGPACSTAFGDNVEREAAEIGEFQSFWQLFRAAVLSDQIDSIIAMTAFPFQSRGRDDRDPIIRHGKREFVRLLPRLLASDPGDPRVQPDQMRLLIQRKVTVDGQDFAGPSRMRIGNFVFEKTNGKWRFVFAYYEPAESPAPLRDRAHGGR